VHELEGSASPARSGQAKPANTEYFSSWGGQLWQQPPFRRPDRLEKLVGGQDCPPHIGL
jgi:hypothetical protein